MLGLGPSTSTSTKTFTALSLVEATSFLHGGSNVVIGLC